MVAIKRFLETEDDMAVRKMALREIRMLKVHGNFYICILISHNVGILFAFSLKYLKVYLLVSCNLSFK
jgi:hypothetical protein